MSNHLAVAMATAALSRTLSEALAAGLPGGVDSAVVTTLRPQTLAATDAAARGINLYLYRTVPNGAASAAELPARRSDGTLAARPLQAVDLHYLLTFSGDDTSLEPQRLLGLAVTALAVRPVLSREVLRRTVQEAVQADPRTWQQYADLDQQPDIVRLSPLPLDVEDLTKLWAMLFHSPYRLSLAYQATVVLLEGDAALAPVPEVRERTIQLAPSTAAPSTPGTLGRG